MLIIIGGIKLVDKQTVARLGDMINLEKMSTSFRMRTAFINVSFH